MATISERLLRTNNASHKAVFNTLKHEVLKAIADGNSYSKIWNLLRNEGRLTCSYSQFCRLVHQAGKFGGFTPDVKAVSAPRSTGGDRGGNATPLLTVRLDDKPEPTIGGFRHQHYDKEDLV